MSDIVFILGAGASRQAGGPLMGDFLDIAESLLRLGRFADRVPQQQDFELVFRGIAALQPVLAKALIDTDNLEAVFSAFEMANLFTRLGELKPDEVRRLPDAIRTVIVRTLEERILFPLIDSVKGGRGPASPSPYGEFCAFVAKLHQHAPPTVSVMTFNYDVCLDFGFFQEQIELSYHLPEEETVWREVIVGLQAMWGDFEVADTRPVGQDHRNGRLVPAVATPGFENVGDRAGAQRVARQGDLDGGREFLRAIVVEKRVEPEDAAAAPRRARPDGRKASWSWDGEAQAITRARRIRLLGGGEQPVEMRRVGQGGGRSHALSRPQTTQRNAPARGALGDRSVDVSASSVRDGTGRREV